MSFETNMHVVNSPFQQRFFVKKISSLGIKTTEVVSSK